MVAAYLALLALIALERWNELRISRSNLAWARARGAVEYGQGHYPVMKLLHTALLVGSAVEVIVLRRPFVPALAAVMALTLVGAQVLRYWVIATLGPHWNVRVVVVPGSERVRRGPFRFLRHPNYLAVALEGIAIPLLHTAWVTAAAFTLLNLWLLAVRIRCEEHALAEHTT